MRQQGHLQQLKATSSNITSPHAVHSKTDKIKWWTPKRDKHSCPTEFLISASSFTNNPAGLVGFFSLLLPPHRELILIRSSDLCDLRNKSQCIILSGDTRDRAVTDPHTEAFFCHNRLFFMGPLHGYQGKCSYIGFHLCTEKNKVSTLSCHHNFQ